MNTSSKRLEQSCLRYKKNSIIKENPDELPPDEDKLLNWVPRYLEKLLDGKPKERIHAAAQLQTMTNEKKFVKALILSKNFVETICYTMVNSEDGGSKDAHRRCQQLCLSMLNNLLLNDPVLDQFIANDDYCLPGIANMLLTQHKLTQDLVATAFDYLSVTETSRTLIASTYHMLYGVVQLLHNTKSITAREHALQGLLYLSDNEINRFIIPRQPGMLDALTFCLHFVKSSIPLKTLQILQNICSLKENVPLVANHEELRQCIQAIVKRVKNEEDSESETASTAPQSPNSSLLYRTTVQNTGNATLQSETIEIPQGTEDLAKINREINSIGTILLQLIFHFDIRLTTDVIFENKSFNQLEQLSIPHSNGEYLSESIVCQSYQPRSYGTPLTDQSISDEVHTRRKLAAARRRKNQ